MDLTNYINNLISNTDEKIIYVDEEIGDKILLGVIEIDRRVISEHHEQEVNLHEYDTTTSLKMALELTNLDGDKFDFTYTETI